MAITTSFTSLDEEKQKRIINAALKEFADNGYDRASTNQMVKNAGIGKGMLFYYFNSKKKLFHYLIEYSLDVTATKFLDRIDTSETDFFERTKQLARIKTEYYLKYIDVMNFLGSFMLKDELKVPADLKERYEEVMQLGYSKTYDNVDKTLFRNDLDQGKVFRLIQWAIEGYQNELISIFKGQSLSDIDVNPYWEEFYEYLDILKKSFYKQ